MTGELGSLYYLIPVLVFLSVMVATAGLLTAGARRSGYRTQVNERLFTRNAPSQSESELVRVRRSRSLSGEGHYSLPFIAFNRLVLQSGIKLGTPGVIVAMAALATAAFVIARYFGFGWLIPIAASAFVGIMVPIQILRLFRTARQRKFEEQLPDAMDTMVRGLKAGHAIPVAISSVAREAPAPLGSEFQITASELTYGLDLETALVNLRTRVGQSDLALLVIAISIQAKIGGNLAEILKNLAQVIRARFKLRRKARALSAEGRFSAIFLSSLPVIVFAALWLISPGYYGQVWDDPWAKPILGASIVWMLLGNAIMYKMVRLDV
jgi:tight adherence protein B